MERRLYKREIVGIVLIILLLVAVITTSIYLSRFISDNEMHKMSVENVYRHAYYSLMENYVDIETDLAKMRVISGDNMAEEVLGNVSDNASLAGLALSTLNTNNNNLTSIFKFTNQVGDYAKYLRKKVENGGKISEGERATLTKMHDIARKIGKALASVRSKVNADSYKFIDKLGTNGDVFSLAIKELNNGSIEYPALIYDGPFSDGIHDRKPKNLTGDKITKEDGLNKIKRVFHGVKDVKYQGTNTNKFTSFLYDVRMEDGGHSSIQLSEIGGHILMFTSFTPEGVTAVGEDEAKEIGRLFLVGLGYQDMYPVYVSLSHGAYYINYAPRVDGIIYYPDLIKVKISASTGKITGMESLNYIYNHVDRKIDRTNLIGAEEAISAMNVDVDITSVRLALIPKGVDKEILTYEVIGTLDDSRYYIYVDAVTRREVNVLMEINGSGGNLLI